MRCKIAGNIDHFIPARSLFDTESNKIDNDAVLQASANQYCQTHIILCLLNDANLRIEYRYSPFTALHEIPSAVFSSQVSRSMAEKKGKSPEKPAKTPRTSTRVRTSRAAATTAATAASETPQPTRKPRGRKPKEPVEEDADEEEDVIKEQPEDDIADEGEYDTPSAPSQAQSAKGKPKGKGTGKIATSGPKPKPARKGKKPTKAELEAEKKRDAEEEQEEEEDEDLSHESEEVAPPELPPPVGPRRSTRGSKSPEKLEDWQANHDASRRGAAGGRGRGSRASSTTSIPELTLPPPATTGAQGSPTKPRKPAKSGRKPIALPETIEEESESPDKESISPSSEVVSTEIPDEQRSSPADNKRFQNAKQEAARNKAKDDARKKEEEDAKEKKEQEREASQVVEQRQGEERFESEDEASETEQPEVVIDGTAAVGSENVVEHPAPTPRTAGKLDGSQAFDEDQY